MQSGNAPEGMERVIEHKRFLNQKLYPGHSLIKFAQSIRKNSIDQKLHILLPNLASYCFHTVCTIW